MSVLEVRGCSIRFGGVQAARNVTLQAGEWEIVGIIGPNGAGKTTTFNIITGFYKPDAGSVWFKGQDVTGLGVDELNARAEVLVDLLGLADVLDSQVQGLPYGVLKRVEIATVLATDPDVVLLDEPSSGMGPEEAHQLGDTLLELRREFGLSICMIEHHVPLVVRVCDYVYCLNFGQMLAEGKPDVVRNHPQVLTAYLGEDATDPNLQAV